MLNNESRFMDYILSGALPVLASVVTLEILMGISPHLATWSQNSSLDELTFALEAVGLLATIAIAYPVGLATNLLSFRVMKLLGYRDKLLADFVQGLPLEIYTKIEDVHRVIDKMPERWQWSKNGRFPGLMKLMIHTREPQLYEHFVGVWNRRVRLTRNFSLSTFIGLKRS